MEAIYWLVLFIILVIIEIVTLGLTTIWFAAGSLIAFVAALLGGGLGVQLVLFFVVSLILLFFTRPFAVRYVNKDRAKTNVEGIVGKTGIVTETIQNLQGQGTVVIAGQEWSARTPDEHETIEKDSTVTVLKVRGVTLIVEKNKEDI